MQSLMRDFGDEDLKQNSDVAYSDLDALEIGESPDTVKEFFRHHHSHDGDSQEGKIKWHLNVKSDQQYEVLINTPVKALVRMYSRQGTSFLDRKDLRRLLTDLSKGARVTDDELDFVMGVADANDDKVITSKEMITVLSCWHHYQSVLPQINKYFARHSSTDKLTNLPAASTSQSEEAGS